MLHLEKEDKIREYSRLPLHTAAQTKLQQERRSLDNLVTSIVNAHTGVLQPLSILTSTIVGSIGRMMNELVKESGSREIEKEEGIAKETLKRLYDIK